MSGKVLSSKNESSLSAVYGILTQLLLESGVSKAELMAYFKQQEIISASGSDTEEVEPEEKQVSPLLQANAEAGDFNEKFNRQLWFIGVKTALETIEYQIVESQYCDRPVEAAVLYAAVADFKTVMEGYLKEMPDPKGTYHAIYCAAATTVEKDKLVRASSFSKSYEIRTWTESLHSACSMLASSIEANIFHEVEEERTVKPGGQRLEETSKLRLLKVDKVLAILNEFVEILNKAIASRPAIEELKASGVTPDSIKKLEEATDQERVKIEIKCSATTTALNANAEKVDLNKQPFSGVLFRVDEISDGIPAAGSTKRLYVPRQTAQIAVDIINASGGMPLDIKDDMSGHNDSNITGVMTSAAIVGNDCVVYGHLFPFNKPAEATAIATHVKELGMSINAQAASHDEVIVNPLTGEPETVAWIDELYPLGANILFSKLATWQSTKVLQAQKTAEKRFGRALPVGLPQALSPVSPHPGVDGTLAASRREISPQEHTPAGDTQLLDSSNTMTDNNTNTNNSSLEAIQSLLSNFIQASQKETQDLKQEINEGFNQVNDRVNQLEAAAKEREEIIVSLKAEKEQQQLQQLQQQEAADKKSKAEEMAQLVQAAVSRAINPNAHPPSLTAVEPLVAGASQTATAAPSKTQMALIAAEARLEAYETSGVTSPDRIKASDEVKRLRGQLHQESAFGRSF